MFVYPMAMAFLCMLSCLVRSHPTPAMLRRLRRCATGATSRLLCLRNIPTISFTSHMWMVVRPQSLIIVYPRPAKILLRLLFDCIHAPEQETYCDSNLDSSESLLIGNIWIAWPLAISYGRRWTAKETADLPEWNIVDFPQVLYVSVPHVYDLPSQGGPSLQESCLHNSSFRQSDAAIIFSKASARSLGENPSSNRSGSVC